MLTSVHNGNIGSLSGIGFPAWTGGALQFIRSEGVKRFSARTNLPRGMGPRFTPPAILRTAAAG